MHGVQLLAEDVSEQIGDLKDALVSHDVAFAVVVQELDGVGLEVGQASAAGLTLHF